MTNDTYAEFLKFMKKIAKDHDYDEDFKKWHKKIVESEPVRANQGDMYFARKIEGAEESEVATPVGEANETIMTQAIKNTTEK